MNEHSALLLRLGDIAWAPNAGQLVRMLGTSAIGNSWAGLVLAWCPSLLQAKPESQLLPQLHAPPPLASEPHLWQLGLQSPWESWWLQGRKGREGAGVAAMLHWCSYMDWGVHGGWGLWWPGQASLPLGLADFFCLAGAGMKSALHHGRVHKEGTGGISGP